MHDSCLKPWEPNFSWPEKKQSVESVLFIYTRGQLSPRDIILVSRASNSNLKYCLYSFDILCPDHLSKECSVPNHPPCHFKVLLLSSFGVFFSVRFVLESARLLNFEAKYGQSDSSLLCPC